MVLTIILSVLALAVGILIGWLLMRPRQASLTTQLELLQQQRQQDLQDREANFQRQLQLVKEQMQNETRQVLDQRAEALGKSKREQMSDVVKPLKEQLEAVQKQVKATENSSTANRASIEKAIEDLVKRTIEMSNDARGLTRALQGDNRTIVFAVGGQINLKSKLINSGILHKNQKN